MTLTRLQIDGIKQEQTDYFSAVRETDVDGNGIKNGCYRQVLKSEGLAYWVDVFDGPRGMGWVVREEVTNQGVVYQRAIAFGPEQWLTHDWLPVDSMG